MAGSAGTGYFGLGVETVVGTSVAPTKFLPVKDVDFPVDVTFIDFMEIRGSRQAQQKFDGPVESSVTATSSFYPSLGMGLLLKGLFGAVTTAPVSGSTIAFAHTFSDAATLPSFSFERSDTTGSSGLLIQRVTGAKVESLGFSCAFGEDVEVSISAQGLTFPETPSSRPVTITYPAADPFIFTGASIQIDGTDNLLFKSIDFDFTNTLERQQTLRKTRNAYRMFEGGMDATLSGTLAFESLALYEKFKNSDYLTVGVKFEGAVADSANATKYSAAFGWPKVKVSNHSMSMSAGEVIEVDVDFEISYDNATGQRTTCVLTNLDPATTYNT